MLVGGGFLSQVYDLEFLPELESGGFDTFSVGFRGVDLE